jgi:hypothetical protein
VLEADLGLAVREPRRIADRGGGRWRRHAVGHQERGLVAVGGGTVRTCSRRTWGADPTLGTGAPSSPWWRWRWRWVAELVVFAVAGVPSSPRWRYASLIAAVARSAPRDDPAVSALTYNLQDVQLIT